MLQRLDTKVDRDPGDAAGQLSGSRGGGAWGGTEVGPCGIPPCSAMRPQVSSLLVPNVDKHFNLPENGVTGM